ncbi:MULTISPECIES: transposase [unclassified Flavobacterium]|jgi:REP element-mobilizing transposase RayT|uniref:transposase n=1 Tax=unclassified Flavobacterium TaxID=196869 RepID=UPI0025BDD419|nr:MULTISPECIES: transposase [unclassified Flavobacterium]
MQSIEPLENGKYYHVYNRGINSDILFKENSNYEHFLKLHDLHIEPMAETYAWCLMKNHFHFLIRIKDVEEIKTENKIQPSQSFSNLFNAYTKAFNKKYNRHGALFERPFKRKSIENENYFQNIIAYIHNNPVHHLICEHPINYPWSSYITCLSDKPTKLKRKEVIEIFDDIENFKHVHQLKSNDFTIETFLGI